jgi:hypothetical protein
MKRLGSMIFTVAVVTAIAGASSFAGQAPAGQAPAPQRKLVAPVRGDAEVEITKPDTKVTGKDVVTIIRVKNVMTSPIAGFKIEENWFKGSDAIGGDVYRHTRPFQPGEVIQVTLTTPRERVIGRTNQYQFSHANGAIKPKAVAKLDLPKPTT